MAYQGGSFLLSLIETNPRYRINATQSSGNIWTFNATAEDKDTKVRMTNNPEDPGDTAWEPLGLKLLSLIVETEKVFREDGRILASDPTTMETRAPKSYAKDRKINWYMEHISAYEQTLNSIKANLSADTGTLTSRD